MFGSTRTFGCVAAMGLLLLGACDTTPTENPGRQPAAQSVFSANGAHGKVRTLDDEYAAFVREVPGFGGIYIDRSQNADGVLTLVTTNPGFAKAARVPVEGLLRRLKRDDLVPLAGNLQVVQAEYDFARLAGWHAALMTRLPAGVVRTDVDERRNRLVVGVRDAAARDAALAAAAAAGVPRGALVVMEEPMTENLVTIRQVIRPLIGGIQIASYAGTCTLGFIAKRRYVDYTYDPTLYFVTNSHCTDSHGEVTGMAMGQPDIYNPVGVEVADPALFDSNTNGSCPVGRQCRYSDAALFSINSTVTYNFPRIVTVGSSSYQFTMDGTHLVNGQVNAVVGDLARKVGRTSGFTESDVEVTCGNYAQSNNGYDTGRTMICQSSAGMTVDPGDSGSPVYIRRNGSSGYVRDALGIIWGSGGVFSNISSVASELVGPGEQLFVGEHLGRTY